MSQTLHLGASPTSRNQQTHISNHPSLEALRQRHERLTERDRLQATLEEERTKFSVALRGQREARQHAEQRLAEAEGIIREMETRLAHAVLARDEAVAAAMRSGHLLYAAEAALDAERSTRDLLEARLSEPAFDQPKVDIVHAEPNVGGRAPVGAISKRGRPMGSGAVSARKRETKNRLSAETADPQPVKFWLKK